MNLLPELDVAIIGGGVSGIYTAYRLLKTAPSAGTPLAAWKLARAGRLAVRVYEGMDRIGGRLLSATPPGMPKTICEIGGMRYVSSQTLASSLIENELNLPRHEQVVDQPQNLAYLRGARLHRRDLTCSGVIPYALTDAEKTWIAAGNDPTGLIGWAVGQLLPGVQTLTGDALQSYLQSATIDGSPLYEHGFWNVIARALSNEAYQLCRTIVGYDSLGSNANAVDMTKEYFDFTPGVKYYLLDDGYDAVPWKLETQFREAGGEILLGQWLRSFDACTLSDGTIGVRLVFADDSQVIARSIVLAMPRRAIELLEATGPVLNPNAAPRFRSMLNAVEPVPLYKMVLAYPYPWWDVRDVNKGRSLTDLPIRQCYYWSVENQNPGGNPSCTNAALMCYNDVSSVEFWGGLRLGKRGPGDSREDVSSSTSLICSRGKPFIRKPQPKDDVDTSISDDWSRRRRLNWEIHKAPHEMVMEMHRQLLDLHGVKYAPEPYDASFMDWSDDPFGGGVHFWNPGYKSWELLHKMTQPVEDFPCMICGEAFSTNQTWVEGALQTAEIVLQKRFGLSAPSWLST